MQSTEIGILSSLYTRIHRRKLEVDESGCEGTAELCYYGRSVSVLFVSCSEAVRGGTTATIGPCVPIILCTHINLVWQVGAEWLRELAEYLSFFV